MIGGVDCYNHGSRAAKTGETREAPAGHAAISCHAVTAAVTVERPTEQLSIVEMTLMKVGESVRDWSLDLWPSTRLRVVDRHREYHLVTRE